VRLASAREGADAVEIRGVARELRERSRPDEDLNRVLLRNLWLFARSSNRS
jgi:hypothetical protein